MKNLVSAKINKHVFEPDSYSVKPNLTEPNLSLKVEIDSSFLSNRSLSISPRKEFELSTSESGNSCMHHPSSLAIHHSSNSGAVRSRALSTSNVTIYHRRSPKKITPTFEDVFFAISKEYWRNQEKNQFKNKIRTQQFECNSFSK